MSETFPEPVSRAIQLFLQAQQRNRGERKEHSQISQAQKEAEAVLISYLERSGKSYLAIGEADQRQFFTVKTEQKKDPINEEFMREGYIAFRMKKMGVEGSQAQQEGHEFANFMKEARQRSAVVKKKLELRKTLPHSFLFDVSERL